MFKNKNPCCMCLATQVNCDKKIVGWLKMFITMTEIDVGKFQAHSVQGASTSKAKTFGMSTQQIIERNIWEIQCIL